MYYYICNCIDCLDNEDFLDRVASDATMLEQMVDEENGEATEITRQEFCEKCVVPESLQHLLDKQDVSFGENYGVCWMYDQDEDIHYFFC